MKMQIPYELPATFCCSECFFICGSLVAATVVGWFASLLERRFYLCDGAHFCFRF